MGGRGGTSGFGKNSVFEKNAKVQTIETIYRKPKGYSPGYYTETVLSARAGKDGEIEFVYATPVKKEQTAPTNRTVYLTYKEKAGANGDTVFGINWKNVKSVSGQTFVIKDTIKENGFRWDGKSKKWIRK
jgi:hypothetical protein